MDTLTSQDGVKVILVRGPGWEDVVCVLENGGIPYKVASRDEIDEEKVISQIRLLPPQIRGKVRYGRGKPLPLTRSGRLNVQNTCILLIYRAGKLVDVYPKQMGTRYISAREGAELIARGGEYTHLYEEPLLVLLANHPELLRCRRVKAVKKRVDASEGEAEIDLIMEDENGAVIVEVEEKAGREAVSQALSLAQAYEKTTGEKVARIALIALKIEKDAARAAEKAGIEVCKVSVELV